MVASDSPPNSGSNRLISIDLDDSLSGGPSPDTEHERKVAIYDLLADNIFDVHGGHGPFRVKLSINGGRLVFEIHDSREEHCSTIGLALSPFRGILKDYFLICESYFKAIRTATPSQIETIDMARRALHNEGSEILKERLTGKVEIDFDTARRLFTLLCALHWRG